MPTIAVKGYTGNAEFVSGTSVAINCTAGTGCKFECTTKTGDGIAAFWYRVIYNTATVTNTWSFSDYRLDYVFNTSTASEYFRKNLDIWGLTTNSTYWYKLQTLDNYTTTATWATSTSASGSFTTLTTGSNPTAQFTVNTTTGFAPLLVTFTDSATSPTTNDVNFWRYTGYTNITITNWQWQSNKSGNFSTYIPVAGTFTVEQYVQSPDGVDTETKSSLIHVVAATVTASFTSTTETIDWPASRRVKVILRDTSTGNSITNNPIDANLWTITKPSATTETHQGKEIELYYGTNVTDAGFYTVRLSATSRSGMTGTATATNLFSVPFLPPVANFRAAPLVSAYSTTITFTNSGTADGMSCQWSFGDTQTSTALAAVLTHSYSTIGLYTVGLYVTGSTISGTQVTTASTVASTAEYIYVMSENTYAQTLGGALHDIQRHLLCDPDKNLCSTFEDFGGTDQLLTIYYRRLWQFLGETELLQLESPTGLTEVSGVYSLPGELVKLLRVEVDSYAVDPMDAKQADLWDPTWAATTSGDAQGYIIEPEESLSLRLVPKVQGKTVKVLYVHAPNKGTVPSDCVTWDPLPLPYALSWVIKWGVIADLLGKEGEMNDPVRATFAEEMYQMGVTATKALITRRAQ